MKLFFKLFYALLIGSSMNGVILADTVTLPCDSENKKNECMNDCSAVDCANEMRPCEDKTPCCQMQTKNDEASTAVVAPTSLNAQNSTICSVVKKVAPLCFAIGFLMAYHKLSEVDEKIEKKATVATTNTNSATATTTSTDETANNAKSVVKAISSCYSKTIEDIMKAIVAVFATDIIKEFLKEVKKTGTDFIAENTSFAC
ncbi:MAG: hypothetical protein BWY54_00526 [Candidatus Dependentiae bacterium ADurb.Bin331]|nr:MAG: hypothetical protein BWY54_00526 [Candidatus Dependentiae bacterium ADurb.Bin331]